MIDFDTAKMHVENTMTAAFTKTAGTKRERVNLAKTCCRMAPTNSGDSVRLLMWAVKFAEDWKA